MTQHRIVSPQEWLTARRQLLEKEKAFTRQRDELSRERRELPWEKVEKRYDFDTPRGRRSLPQLFAGRGQLVVYHFMFAPEWEVPCKSCSFWADNFNGIVAHLGQRDVTMLAISRAPLAKIEAFKKRLGWTFDWVSSGEGEFNYDYHVSFGPQQQGEAEYNYRKMTGSGSMTDMPGVSVFLKDANGDVFHTYSTFGRGIDILNTAYNYLDLVPKGRDEQGLPFPMAWVKHHDLYPAGSP